jgi:hypothetical protein
MRRALATIIAITMTAAAFAASTAHAQPAGPGPGNPPAAGGPGPGAGPGPGYGPGRGYGWGPGSMMGPGMMGWRGMAGMCDPRAAGLAEWRAQRIASLVKPTDAQKKALDDLRAASAKAAETIAAACPRDFPTNASQRMELMEKRLEAMLTAIKTVRPAFDAFYNSLTDEQKARVNAAGPRRWGWRGWRNP